MTLPIVVHPSIPSDIEETCEWYERQREGLGTAFRMALNVEVQRIQRLPHMNRVVWRDVRRALLRRFPYAVFYRVLLDRIELISVYHTHRDSSGWQSRV